jgi:hypothetical protein
MNTKIVACLLFFISFGAKAQQTTIGNVAGIPEWKDSVITKAHASYDNHKGMHRWLFGENYRKEWALPVKLPVFKISELKGGLKMLRYGGGMQTKSVRFADKTGKEWVIRSVEKVPDKILPAKLQGTFAVDWVDDEMSGQHPYSALVVPPLADAIDVPHTNPVIGVLAPDTAMGEFSKNYSGHVVLFEEREPTGHSQNTLKVLKELSEDHNNRFDKEEFLRARMLDVLIADWDRHEDQWRFTEVKKGKDKYYTAVPRDRDQVFHITAGVFPSIAALPWVDPILENFGPDIPSIKYSLYKTRFIQPYPDAQFNHDEYMRVVNQVVKAETDSVLEASLRRLPSEIYRLRHDELLNTLKKRRDNLPAAMEAYYRFICRIVDIRVSDKDEYITITDAGDHGMRVVVDKDSKKDRNKEQLMDVTYDASITREIRLYVMAGDDHVIVNTPKAVIKLRIVGTNGNKSYDIQNSDKKVIIYGRTDSINLLGNTSKISKRLSNDTSNTRFETTNPYNVWMPLINGEINRDDGFLLGLGFKYTGMDGFRKLPYSTVQEVMINHSFETNAFSLNYNGQWIQAIGKADLTLHALVDAPNNTMNFFGRGNGTVLDKTGDYREFYRTRFDYYTFAPALRWPTGKGSTFSFGPALQLYHLNPDDNTGRFISHPELMNSYDNTTVDKDKVHLGFIANFISNKKNNNLFPSKGYHLDVRMEGYGGLNSYSRSYFQVKPEFSYFLRLDTAGIFVLSDRIGGGISIGNPAFYQSMFLGGQGNLLGFLKNRFAGQDMIFNNFQARLRLAKIPGYILPGQFGVSAFFDTGRVWVSGDHSDKFHYGTGGGLYFAPASMTVLQILAGHSVEGWYPYVSFNFRF